MIISWKGVLASIQGLGKRGGRRREGETNGEI